MLDRFTLTIQGAVRDPVPFPGRKSTSLKLATTLTNFAQLGTTCRYFLKLGGSSGKLYLYDAYFLKQNSQQKRNTGKV